MKKLVKTNVMRLLDAAKIAYEAKEYPVDGEVDLKKAARAAGDKKVEMLPMKELLPVTGYVRGGCSPIGMKKRFPIYLDQSAEKYEKIAVSAGMRGVQVILSPADLGRYVGAEMADLM